MKMRFLLSLALAAASFAVLPGVVRAAGHPAPAAAPATVTGEVIDSACYIKGGSKGEAHAKCAQACAEAGIPLAILEDGTNKVIWVASKEDMQTPNEQLKPYAGKKVVAKGTWAERGGARLLILNSVAPVGK
ncbi:MAG TPA: hypothetical protein VMM92_08640 [Thermoanaerobaculia bacterium]|nr:hypothetical protein [Thermoanaerobaculia bacterium]